MSIAKPILSAAIAFGLVSTVHAAAPVPKLSTWDQFKRIAGDTESSRRLFNEMMADKKRAEMIDAAMASDAVAFESYEKHVKKVQVVYSAIIKELKDNLHTNEGIENCKARMREAISNLDITVGLFLGSRQLPGAAVDPKCAALIFVQPMAEALNGPDKATYRKLFLTHLERRKDAESIHFGFTVALYSGVSEVLPLARIKLGDKSLNQGTVGRMLHIVGNHGTKDDLKLLTTFRNDNRICNGNMDNRSGPIANSTELRDIAATMSLQLCGENFTEYGFDSSHTFVLGDKSNSKLVMTVGTFRDDIKRQESLKRAWDWLDKQPKSK